MLYISRMGPRGTFVLLMSCKQFVVDNVNYGKATVIEVYYCNYWCNFVWGAHIIAVKWENDTMGMSCLSANVIFDDGKGGWQLNCWHLDASINVLLISYFFCFVLSYYLLRYYYYHYYYYTEMWFVFVAFFVIVCRVQDINDDDNNDDVWCWCWKQVSCEGDDMQKWVCLIARTTLTSSTSSEDYRDK